MLAVLFALVTAAPEIPYKLIPGDTWTVERSLHFHGGALDVDQTQVETIRYIVSGTKDSLKLTATWKLKETRLDGEAVPVPKDIQPLVQTLQLTGEAKDTPGAEPDLARYRIERMMSWGRAEPEFWPVPPTVRVVGVKGEPVFAGNDKPGLDSYTLDRRETGGDHPMTSHGDFTVYIRMGIVMSSRWKIANAPMPGGDDVYDLDVTTTTTEFKPAARK